MELKEESTPSIVAKNINFYYERFHALRNISFELAPGSRCLLLGANGSGKSTLLRVLGGKHMLIDDKAAQILGHASFKTDKYVEYLGSTWQRTVAFSAYNVSYQADIPVKEMCQELQNEFPDRRDMLLDLLDVDPNWKMHLVSDGQRRRVQLFLGLIRPFKVLFLDEITVDLDVLARANFLDFLKQECESRGATVVYATHIFDGLEDWATHLAYLNKGSLQRYHSISEVPELDGYRKQGKSSPLLNVIYDWLKADRDEQKRQHQKTSESQQVAQSSSTNNGFGPGRFYNYYGAVPNN